MEIRSREQPLTQKQVYEVYRELIEKPDAPRKVHHGKQYYQDGDKWGFPGHAKENTIPEGHTRRSVFTKEQETLNDKCRLILVECITSDEKGLYKRFTDNWDESGKQKGDFEPSIAKAFTECLDDAFDRDPALLPAFFGFVVSSFNGAEGLQEALSESVYPIRVHGTNLGENYPSFIKVVNASGESSKYEVQCAAPVVAMKTIESGRKCLKYAGLDPGNKDLKTSGSPITVMAETVRFNLRIRMMKAGYNVPLH